MIRIEEQRERLQLDLAPMIDMVFLLIIFFLTATTFTEKEREQDVLLPANRSPASLSRALDDQLMVNVVEDGSVRVLGREVGLEELRALVRERLAAVGPALKVQVRGDRRTPYGNVSRAVEVVKAAGVPRAFLVTREEELEAR